MKDWQRQAHVKWECKYHVVIVPKYRKKIIYGKLRHQIGELFRRRERRGRAVLSLSLAAIVLCDHVVD